MRLSIIGAAGAVGWSLATHLLLGGVWCIRESSMRI
jgi:hypothetical protein